MTPIFATVVIANHNYGRFLPDAIESTLAQTYPHMEVVVVDDGSTDDSREIIASYGDAVVSVLKPWGGMASTLNAGVAASRGDVVLLLDADDALFPSAVERAIEAFAGGGVSRVHWPLREAVATGEATGGLVPTFDLDEGDLRPAVIAEGPDGYLSAPGGAGAWGREFLERVLPIPERPFRTHADTYLITLAPLFGLIVSIAEPQGLYRIHGGNDYASATLAEKNRRNLGMYFRRCAALSDWLGWLGMSRDPSVWMEGNERYEWLRRAVALVDDLEALIAEGDQFIFVDGHQLAERWDGSVIRGRHAIPFLERDGRYWGSPADDATAIRELERLRRGGASYLIFAWPAFWWLEHYSHLHRHLRASFRCVADNEQVVAFDLREAA